MSDIPELFKVPGFHTTLIPTDETAELQAFLEKCGDYSLLVTGSLPGPSTASSLLVDCPPRITIKDKVVLGFSIENQGLFGVLDSIRGFPTQESWWLGLLLLDPSQRNKGLGHRIVHSFEHWVSQQGAKRIFLGVVEENERAYLFWKNMGFQVIERQPARQFGNRSHVVITMMKNLPEGEND